MAVLVTADVPGQTAQGYDSMLGMLANAVKQAPGFVLHTAHPIEGGWRTKPPAGPGELAEETPEQPPGQTPDREPKSKPPAGPGTFPAREPDEDLGLSAG